MKKEPFSFGWKFRNGSKIGRSKWIRYFVLNFSKVKILPIFRQFCRSNEAFLKRIKMNISFALRSLFLKLRGRGYTVDLLIKRLWLWKKMNLIPTDRCSSIDQDLGHFKTFFGRRSRRKQDRLSWRSLVPSEHSKNRDYDDLNWKLSVALYFEVRW